MLVRKEKAINFIFVLTALFISLILIVPAVSVTAASTNENKESSLMTEEIVKDNKTSNEQTEISTNKAINKEIDNYSVGVLPDQLFTGTVGDHPLLESFGDTEGGGVLSGTARDTGTVRVIPYSAKTTPGRQMSMKLGNFKYNSYRSYPKDSDYVSSFVYENALNTSTKGPEWNSIILDTASVGFNYTDNGNQEFYDVNMSAYQGRSLRGTSYKKAANTGFTVKQASIKDSTLAELLNMELFHWGYSETLPGGGSNHTGTSSPKDAVVLMKMYHSNSADRPYSVAYGAHVDKVADYKVGPLDLLGYVRIIMQPINDDGRVRINYSYINLTTQPERNYSAFSPNFGGAPFPGAVSSLGQDKGEYFSVDRAGDGNSYAYAVFRDDYPLIGGAGSVSSPIGRYFDFSNPNMLFKPGITPKDPGAHEKFVEKGLGYIGEKKATPFGEVASWDLDIQGFNTNTLTVNHVRKDKPSQMMAPKEVSTRMFGEEYVTKPKTDIPGWRAAKPYPVNATGIFEGKDIEVTYHYEPIPKEGKVITHYVDENNKKIITDDVFIGEIGGADYVAKPKLISDYIYTETKGTAAVSVNVTISETEQEVTFIYMKQDEVLNLIQKVENSTGDSVDKKKARQGETLTYSLQLKTADKLQQRAYLYHSATISTLIDPSLENVKNIEVKTKSGKIVGTGTYDKVTNRLDAELTDVGLESKEDLLITFQGTIKMTAKVGEIIKQAGQADVKLKVADIETQTILTKSNEVITEIGSGQLELISAPLIVDFGTVKVVDFQKKVGVDKTNISTPLIVADNRVNKKKWDVVASVVKELTNGDDVQNGAFKYRYKNKELTLKTDIQTIYENDGTSGNEEYNITNTWGKAESAEGLKLEIASSKVPKVKGNYEGTIKWTLRETIE